MPSLLELKLSAVQRRILAVRLESQTNKRAARKLGMTSEAVRKSIFRAMANLSVDQRTNYLAALSANGKPRVVKALSLSMCTNI